MYILRYAVAFDFIYSVYCKTEALVKNLRDIFLGIRTLRRKISLCVPISKLMFDLCFNLV